MLESHKSDNPALPRPGELFAERYSIEALIGRGGYANVYRATQKDLQREVAVKILATCRQHDSETLDTAEKRFYREARLLSKLHSPTTLRMFDYGRSADGLLFMVFEFIDGRTLSELIRSSAGLEPARVRPILIQILHSLREAHALSILHRDIKPANIMVFRRLGVREQVKVLDFGIAKTVAAEAQASRQLTVEGAIIGTPRYMSPEQALGRQLSPASDLFSLGLVAYEMLVGQSPFDSAELTMIRRQLVSGPIRLPRTITADDELRQIVDRLLERRVDRRFATAEQVLQALGERVEATDDAPRPEATSTGRGLSFPLCLDSSGLAPVDDLTETQASLSSTMARVDEFEDDHDAFAGEPTLVDLHPPSPAPVDTPARDHTADTETRQTSLDARPQGALEETRLAPLKRWGRLVAGVAVAAGVSGAALWWSGQPVPGASRTEGATVTKPVSGQATQQQPAAATVSPALLRAVEASRRQTHSALRAAEDAARREPVAEPVVEAPPKADRETKADVAKTPSRPSRPNTHKPATKKPATQKPATKKPAANKPAANKPAANKPAAKKPASFKPIDELL